MWINPEIARIMVLKGAKVLAIPTATVATTSGGDIEAMAFTRARENGVFVVSANLVRGYLGADNPEQTVRYYSHSYIAGPDFPRMARIWGSTDDAFGAVTADIDLGQQPLLKLAERRAAGGNRAHISRLVAREYAALTDRAPAEEPALVGAK
jgi:predicted amidohydrolase